MTANQLNLLRVKEFLHDAPGKQGAAGFDLGTAGAKDSECHRDPVSLAGSWSRVSCCGGQEGHWPPQIPMHLNFGTTGERHPLSQDLAAAS